MTVANDIELIRSMPEEKGQQIKNVHVFIEVRNELHPDSLAKLQQTARERIHCSFSRPWHETA